MFRSKHIVPITFALILSPMVYTGLQFSGTPAPPEEPPQAETSLLTEEDVEIAKQLALEAMQTYPEVRSREVFSADMLPGVRNYWERFGSEEYRFVYVQRELSGFDRAVIGAFVVSGEGRVFELPNEFDQFVHDADLALADDEDARVMLGLYLGFDVLRHAVDGHVILSNIEDIPEIFRDPEIAEEYRSVVTPTEVSAGEDGWIFEFFTWQFVGGALIRWEVHVNTNGAVNVVSRERLETEVGGYDLVR